MHETINSQMLIDVISLIIDHYSNGSYSHDEPDIISCVFHYITISLCLTFT